MSDVVVLKFGGSSVADEERLLHVAERIAAMYRKGRRPVVVVSAQGDATDRLVEAAHRLMPLPPVRELDMLLATGEQASAALLSIALIRLGIPSLSLTGWQAGITTDGKHRQAQIVHIDPERIRSALAADKVAVVAGFQGVSQAADVTTLGRGGSDLSAVALAAALDAPCEIYSDVAGVFTTDPRIVPEARKLEHIHYDEMLELASAGAQVLQGRAVEFARDHGVIIHSRSTFSEEEGTLIRGDLSIDAHRPVTGVALDAKTTRITVQGLPDRPGVAGALFSCISEAGISVDMIVQSPSEHGEATNIAFTLADDDLRAAEAALEPVLKETGAQRLVVDPDVAKVSVVGAGMLTRPGVAAQTFTALAQAKVNIQAISTSDIKISCLVSRDQGKEALRVLHRTFNLDR